MKQKPILLITHIADPDGITPIILAKLVFKQLDVLTINPNEVDQKLKENIENYKEIHIVDLSISENYAQEIEQSPNKTKIKIFDHHIGNINLNKYSFAKIIDSQNNKKESGTSLYYQYLTTISKNKILNRQSTKELVNQVRIIDTYDFKTKKDKQAHNIDALFSILGRQNYIEYFTKYIKENKTFKYTKKELFLIKLEQDKMKNYIESKEKQMIKATLEQYKVGIIYAEKYRSDLGNFLVDKHQDLDFIIIINITKSISFRGKDKIDLSTYSKKHKGGGHKNAAGCPLPENLLTNITKQIFKNIKIKEEQK